MKKKNNKKKISLHWKIILQILIVCCITIAVVAEISHSSTTIGNNISSGGTLSVVGNVGIGTTTPSAKLFVEGGGILQSISSNPTLVGYVKDSSMISSEGLYISGKYAYVTSYLSKTLTIIDISLPTSPKVIGSVTDATCMYGASWVHVAGKYAYVTSKVSKAFTVIDISNPENPVKVSCLVDTTNFDTATHVVVIGKYAYVTSSGSNNALTIVDISDPTNPIVAGSITDATKLDKPESVQIRGKYAYVAAEDGNTLSIIDISDPTNPTMTGYLTNASLGGPESVYVSGRYAYVAGEDSHCVSVIDIASSTNPTLVTTLTDTTYLYNPETIYVSGKYAYVVGHGDKFDASYEGDYMTVLDVSTPSNPIVVGSLAGSANMGVPYAVQVRGRYAYVASQGGDLSGWAGTLTVIDIFGIDSPSASFGDLSADKIDVANILQVANNAYFDNGINVGPRGIFTDGALISTATSSYSYFASNVGIGTTSPQSLLTLYESSGDALLSFGDSQSNTAHWFMGIDYSDSNKFKIATSSSQLGVAELTLDKSGNLGIGTTTPATDLNVYNTTATSTIYVDSGSLGGRIILKDADGSGCSEITISDGTISSKSVTCP